MKPGGEDSQPQQDPGVHNIGPAIAKPSKIEWALSGDLAIPKPSRTKRARQARLVQQSDLTAPGVHDISPATPKPPKARTPKVRQVRRREQEEPNPALVLLGIIIFIVVVIIGIASGAFDTSSSGGGGHTSHHR